MHSQNGIFDSILDTSSPQPDDKQDGMRHIAFDMFKWGLGQSGLTIGPWPCAYVDPVFTIAIVIL